MRFLNKIYGNVNLLKVLNVRKRLIISTSFWVLLLIIVNFVLFYIFIMNNYIQQLKDSNESLIKQIGFSYEMVLKNIKNSVFKTTLSDMELQELVRNYDNSFDYRNEIFKKLHDITLANEYIQSVYLYIPSCNQVFSTSNNTEKISSFESFSDQSVFSNIKEKTYYCLEPRLIEHNRVKKLVFSIVSSVPLYNEQNTGFLAVNVDLDKLRYDMMVKFKKSQYLNFYVVNDRNSIIITEKENDRLGKVLENEPVNIILYNGLWGNILYNDIMITSVYHSKFLKWKFILENSINTSTGSLMSHVKNLIWLVNASIFVLTISILLLVVLIIIFTRPINRLLAKYNEELWKNFITDGIHVVEETKQQIMGDWLQFDNAKFGTIVLRIEDNGITNRIISYYKLLFEEMINSLKEQDNLRAKPIVINRNTLAIVICYPDSPSFKACEQKQERLAKMIYERINPLHRSMAYLGISTIKEHISLIPVSYRECVEMFKYKLTFSDSRLLYFSDIRDREEVYEYPCALEKQLLNNLAIGNAESCRALIDEFFSLFTNPAVKITDYEILDGVHRLRDSILRNFNSYFKGDDLKHVANLNVYSLNEIKDAFNKFIGEICYKVIQQDNDEKSMLYKTVVNYIDKYYTQPDISLDKIAETFNLNRNYVSKIVREVTGYNFTDYINAKRIELAKKLLQDTNKTINDIAKEVGFNYSYYFIRIFKSLEGITPGQYRESLTRASI
ncbi:AraC family transcriptional regulator [Caldicoprobacter faecalis]|uniref:Cache domain-containing protein n=1 Tax=Caldicoprobacter faecalis TaxID=937334 RepID=A0A1I5X8X0_9FIRM|nr:helix-turn-helix domain-containing protein [Caldicoprobacter faecalis]SFQ28354.1 Cache domain-containing protein [Caldicoprobacter faecalis]